MLIPCQTPSLANYVILSLVQKLSDTLYLRKVDYIPVFLQSLSRFRRDFRRDVVIGESWLHVNKKAFILILLNFVANEGPRYLLLALLRHC